jgi:signal peptide peptidase SppA
MRSLVLDLLTTSSIFAIERGAWARLLSLLDAAPLTEAEIRLRLGALSSARPTASLPAGGAGIAIIPVSGLLMNRGTFLNSLMGWSTTSAIRAEVQRAEVNPRVDTILMPIDSPGGAVDGIPETAAAVRAAARRKTVIAIADTMATSAAYWLASGASEFISVPSGTTGSVGVFGSHDDLSRAAEMAGVKRTYVSAGRFKVEANPFAPLTDEARRAMQHDVDSFYAKFVADVAAGRRVRPETVINGMGEGRALVAEDALAARLVDRIDTAENTLARVVARTPSARASAFDPSIAARRARLGMLTAEALDNDLQRRRLRLRLAAR